MANSMECPNCGCRLELDARVVGRAAAAPTPSVEGRFNLTPREAAAGNGVLEGLPNKAIAARMKTSEQVVKNLLKVVYDKVGCDSRVEFFKIVTMSTGAM